ncbi:unnamed protein product, partial [Clonostachys rosea]
MRIACLQFAPQVGDVDNNLNRADAVLSKATPDDFDLLVLPELAFSGSNFESLQHISPFLEPSGSGITSLWARTVALKFDCTVIVGYPEKVDVASRWPTGPEYYNSAIVINEDGDTIANCRKTFLYPTDETWALEGEGFHDGFLPNAGQTAIGICTPYKFQAPFHAFEFAFHVLHAECNLVVLTMAWKTGEDARLFSRTPNEPDMDVLGYWVARLEPLIRAESDEEIIVVICNRSGTEDDAVYAGSSAILGIQSGEVKVYGLLGRGDKKLLVVDTNQAPYAKLQHRALPSDSESTTPRSSSRQSSGSKQPSESSHHRAATPSSPAMGREGKSREYSPYTSRPTSPRQDSVSSTKSQDSRAYSSATSSKGKEHKVYSPASTSRDKDKRAYTPVSSSRDKDPASYSPGQSRKEKESKPSSPRKPTPNPGAKTDLGAYTSLDHVVRSSLENKEPDSPSSINSNNYLDPNERESLRQDTPVVRFPDKTSSNPFSQKQIYSGQVSISYVEEGRSPVTPYDENRRAYWSNYK